MIKKLNHKPHSPLSEDVVDLHGVLSYNTFLSYLGLHVTELLSVFLKHAPFMYFYSQ